MRSVCLSIGQGPVLHGRALQPISRSKATQIKKQLLKGSLGLWSDCLLDTMAQQNQRCIVSNPHPTCACWLSAHQSNTGAGQHSMHI
jgi:hypothetical protein